MLYVFIRNQNFVSEKDFLNSMIEYHAMGIAMSIAMSIAMRIATANKYLEPYPGKYGQEKCNLSEKMKKLIKIEYN